MRPWFADTLAKRLFALMWVALVLSHFLAFSLVTWDRPPPPPGSVLGPPPHPPDARPGLPPAQPPGGAPMPTLPSLPPTQGLPWHALVLDYGLRLLVIAAAAWWGARWLAMPVRRLVQAADRLGAGLSARPAPPLDERSGTVEVRDAAAVFNRMAEQLRQQFRQRELLMAAVSHDLRTPLTRLRLRLETSGLPAEQLDRAAADVRELDALIDQALTVFRSHSAPEAAQSLDLAALLQALVDDRQEQGQALSCAPLPASAVVHAPPLALRRVLDNLIGNALRYGLRAEVSLAAQDGGWRIAIDDHGPGIPEAELEAVLQPFYRLESSRNRISGGSGLGLYIAAELSAAMGARLALANRDGAGLRATVWLPGETMPAWSPPPPPGSSATST